MHAHNHSQTQNNTLLLILPNPLIPPTPRIPILLNKIANPASNTLLTLRILTKDRLAVLHFDGRRVDVEVGHVGVDVGAVDSVVAEAERRDRGTGIAEERLGFGEGLGCGSHGGCVAEEGVHVFEADVGGFGVDEPDWRGGNVSSSIQPFGMISEMENLPTMNETAQKNACTKYNLH
jgi:hypothetical protein